MPATISSWKDADHARMLVLAELASYRLEELLTALGVKLRRVGKRYLGPCPVHGGNRFDALQLYPEGHSVRGLWYCRTHRCEERFQRTLPGFVRGVLSHANGWTIDQDQYAVSQRRANEFLLEFLGKTWHDLAADVARVEKHRFVRQMDLVGRAVQVPEDGWSLEDIRHRLRCPSPYFLSRGFPAGILEQYGVGDAMTADANKPMYQRAVVPILGPEGRKVIAVTGRSLHKACPTCGVYHDRDCPPAAERSQPRYAKWRHDPPGFARDAMFFNWFAARDFIRKCGRVVLVEGPMDCLWLVAAGIPHVVALLGTSLSDAQIVLLESTGCLDVTVLLDGDEAGRDGAAVIRKQLGRGFRVHTPDLAGRDPKQISRENLLNLLPRDFVCQS